MESNLLCPMQVWMNDIKVDETPKFLTENPTDIMSCNFWQGCRWYKVIIPLSLKGVTSYFPTRKPTKEEFNSCPHFDLTYEAPIWDPHSEIIEQQDKALLDNCGMLKEWEHDDATINDTYLSV